MKQHLFLTGEIGAGKSTVIQSALGSRICSFGGFLTRRYLDGNGKPVCFCLETPSGNRKEVFLDLSAESPRVHMQVFETLGVHALTGDVLILDEIGGIELLSPVFRRALETVLKRDVPIIGVVKGINASNALASTIGLGEEYRRQSAWLWELLYGDGRSCIYPCEKYDETALAIARQWAREYCL